MPVEDDVLWTKLQTHDFGHSGGLSLVARVEKNTALTMPQAEAAVEEYRRFLYLAANGAQPCVPSGVVLAVWQAHIMDTRAYVDGLCLGLLGRMIHHDPEALPPQKNPHYADTLARYLATFGSPPPLIWPTRTMQRAEFWVTLVFLAGICVLVAAIARESWGLGLIAVFVICAPIYLWLRFGPWPAGRSLDD